MLLAAGELVREFFFLAFKADGGEQFVDPCMSFCAGQFAQAEADVVRNVQVREECVILKNHPDAATLRRETEIRAAYRVPVDTDFTFGDGFKTGDAAQQGCFTAA